jgi:hypothetical protein
VVSNFFRLLFSCCCCVERKEEILPLSLSRTHRASPTAKEDKKRRIRRRTLPLSLCPSHSLSKRTSFFLRARVQSNKRMRFLSFFFLLLLLSAKNPKKKTSLTTTVYVWRDNNTPKSVLRVYIRRRRDLFPLRRCCCCCSLFFFRKPVSLYLSFELCKCVFVNEEKEEKNSFEKTQKIHQKKRDSL